MRRALIVAVLLCAVFGVSAAAAPRRAYACSGPSLTFESLADTLAGTDAAVMGTLRGMDGATIGLDVDTYYKAPPEGRPSRLVVNNLRQDGWPDCSSRPLRMRQFQDETPVIAFLKADEQGVGAQWRGARKQGTGVFPLVDGGFRIWRIASDGYTFVTAAEFDAEMARIGFPGTKPDATTPPERPLAPTSPLTCLYDPPTIESLTAAATLVGVGTLVERTPDVVTYSIDEPLKGATGSTTVRVNNHWFTGGLSDCNEQVGAGNRILDYHEPAFMFLAPDTNGVGADWRPVGIDAVGLFLPGDIPWPNASGDGPLAFETISSEVRKLAQPEPVTPAAPPAKASRDSAGADPWIWPAVALVAVAATGGLALLWLRRR